MSREEEPGDSPSLPVSGTEGPAIQAGPTAQATPAVQAVPAAEVERLRLSPALAGLLGLVIAAFLAGTAYVSNLPFEHRNLSVDLAEGIAVGGAVGAVAGTRGLALRERVSRPPRRPPAGRRRSTAGPPSPRRRGR